jgi:hypothetical protein
MGVTDEPGEIHRLEEWMYAITTALVELRSRGRPQSPTLLQRTLDDMSERRAHLLLRRGGERGL